VIAEAVVYLSFISQSKLTSKFDC